MLLFMSQVALIVPQIGQIWPLNVVFHACGELNAVVEFENNCRRP